MPNIEWEMENLRLRRQALAGDQVHLFAKTVQLAEGSANIRRDLDFAAPALGRQMQWNLSRDFPY